MSQSAIPSDQHRFSCRARMMRATSHVLRATPIRKQFGKLCRALQMKPGEEKLVACITEAAYFSCSFWPLLLGINMVRWWGKRPRKLNVAEAAGEGPSESIKWTQWVRHWAQMLWQDYLLYQGAACAASAVAAGAATEHYRWFLGEAEQARDEALRARRAQHTHHAPMQNEAATELLEPWRNSQRAKDLGHHFVLTALLAAVAWVHCCAK